MPEQHQHATVSGTVIHIFAHRFVVETGKAAMLADLTPHGREKIILQIGDQVTLEGEMKPSELKVSRLTCKGQNFDIGPKDKKDHHPVIEPEHAREFARAAGFEAIGEPRRKPKHFEVLGRRDGKLFELHIELTGQIRKAKPVTGDGKWAEEMRPK